MNWRGPTTGGRKPCLTSRLVGSSNEADVIVESNATKMLIDTGSCVSTISEKYYRGELSNLELQPIDQILNIECSDGKNLPYLGFIDASLEVVGIPMDQTVFSWSFQRVATIKMHSFYLVQMYYSTSRENGS